MPWTWLKSLWERKSLPHWDIVMYTRQGCHLCEQAWQQLERARRRHGFRLRSMDIDGDPELLHKAFQNLVLNALDAMPAGGTLTFRTSETASGVRVEVSDTGKGLTPEECSRLFTPYYTTKQQGTGLGLAIVQSVVSDHRGTISVSSEEGHGTTFRMELPRRQPGVTAKKQPAGAAAEPPARTAAETAAASD